MVTLLRTRNNGILDKRLSEIEDGLGYTGILYDAAPVIGSTVVSLNDVSVGDRLYYNLHGNGEKPLYIQLEDINNNVLAIYGKTSSYKGRPDWEGVFEIPTNFHHLTFRGFNVTGQYAKIVNVKGSAFNKTNNFGNCDTPSLLLDNDIRTNNRLANTKMETLESWNAKNPNNQVEKTVIFNSATPFHTEDGDWSLFRIPVCCITNAGTYIVIAENREGGQDEDRMQYTIARKTANSNEWQRSVLVPFDFENYYRAINPALFVDRTGAQGVAGRIYFFFGWGEFGLWLQKGGEGSYIYSDDDGVTWSNRISLAQYAPSDYPSSMSSNDNGIQLDDGTIVMPGQYYVQGGLATAGLIYKKPNEDWVFSKGIDLATNLSECAVYQRGS